MSVGERGRGHLGQLNSLTSNIVMYLRSVFESDVYKGRQRGEEEKIGVNLGDGACEFVALRRPDIRRTTPWSVVRPAAT